MSDVGKEEVKVKGVAKEDREAEVKEEGKGKKVKEVVKKKGALETSVETSISEVLECVKEGRDVVFYPESLVRIPGEVLLELPYKVAKEYEAAKEEAGKQAKIEVLGILGNNARNRLKLRARRGWHQTWKRPDELDEALDNGYVVVREANKNEAPGKETGEIKKIGNGEKVELIALEINQERYDNHLKAVRDRSVRAYKANKENVLDSVEQFNARVPDRNDRLIVRDDEGDISN